MALSPASGLAVVARPVTAPDVGPAPSAWILRQRRRGRRRHRESSRELTYLAAPARAEDGVGPLIGVVRLSART